MKRLLMMVLVIGCGSSTPAPVPVDRPPRAKVSLTAPTPAPLVAQRFEERDPGFAFADADRPSKLRAAFPKVDSVVADEMKQQNVPGLSLGIVIDGQLAYAKGYGVVAPDSKMVPDADTVYRIGSISKSFTALAVLILRDEGALQLDDSLAKWFPPANNIVYPTRDAQPITLRQLLTHTSGMGRDVGSHDRPTEADIAKQLDGEQLKTPPGTEFFYSNSGFGLLSIVVSHASQSSYRDVLASRVLRPLGMTSTVFAKEDVPAGHLAPAVDDAGKTTEKQEVLGVEEGAGGIYSSVNDMAKYAALQLSAYPPRHGEESAIVKRATLREAHNTGFAAGMGIRMRAEAKTGERAVDFTQSSYGFGWSHNHNCDFDDIVEHNGAIDSYRAVVRLQTDRGVGVVVLTNFGGNPSMVAERVVSELAKTGALVPRVAHPTPSPLLDAAMTKFLAVYNQWDEAALQAILSRPIDPVEHDEVAGYKALHGTCTGFKQGAVTSTSGAHYTLTCERGALDIAIDINGEGKISGFAGTSTKIEVPTEITKLAADAAAMIGKWDERAYERSFADAKKHRDVYFNGSAQLRKAYGACKIKAISHEVFTWTLDLACAHGHAIGSMSVVNGKIVAHRVGPAPGTETTCPLR